MDVLPPVTRTTSTSFVERGKGAPTAGISLMAEDEHLRSKSVAWKGPTAFFQRLSSRRFGSQRLSSSRWARFWRKLRLNSGKKVHAARPEWLNYDAQSYSMNFEKDSQTPNASTQPLPTISGPQAREIVTVLLKRSVSNKNSGFILIPKPVDGSKQEANMPLWQKRGVHEPSSLTIRMRAPSLGRYNSA